MGDWRFHTPGWVDEDVLPKEVLDAWHHWHVRRAKLNLANMLALLPDGVDPGLVPYVDPSCQEVPDERVASPIDWEGFPEQVDTRFGDNALSEVEDRGAEDLGDDRLGPVRVVNRDGNDIDRDHWAVRHRQDEYLEWHAREVNGVLQSVTFVCEGYDYYDFLFSQKPHGRARVVELYRMWTGDDSIQAQDLMAPTDMIAVQRGRPPKVIARAGDFNPRNRFNQETGIVHLSHGANSLGAEVALAVTSALPRKDADGNLLDGANEKMLMCCTAGGDPGRSSDPLIAAGAYKAVNDPAAPGRFTLTDPIGLYIKTWEHAALRNPRTKRPAPRDWWQVLRGKDATDPSDPHDARVLRLHLEVPDDAGFQLGEVLVGDDPIEHPGQLARLIKMHLLADIWSAPVPAPAIDCEAGCCRTNGLLQIYLQDEPPCRTGVDEWPNLIVPTSAPAVADTLDGAPVPMGVGRRLQ
jgi:hypothetical protein